MSSNIEAYKKNLYGNDNGGKVDDYLPSRKSSSQTQRKWKPTPTAENQRADDWLGGSPAAKKRSWKVKSIKPVIPDPDA
jgi:hypothetical protein